MFWYALLAVVAVLFVLSVALPVPRRMWAFSLITAKYFWLWVFDTLRLRRVWFAITGRSALVCPGGRAIAQLVDTPPRAADKKEPVTIVG